MACCSCLTQVLLRKGSSFSFFFFLLLSHAHPVAVRIVAFLSLYPDHVAEMPCETREEPDWLDRLGANWDTAEPSFCSALTNWALSARPFRIHRLVRHPSLIFLSFPLHQSTTTDPSQSDCTNPVLAETMLVHLQSTPRPPP